MTRSITGALLGTTAVLAAALLSGCSAGLQTQTSTQVAPIPGVDADIVVETGGGGSGRIALRNALIAYQDLKGYPRGGTAPLMVNLINETGSAVTLTGVTVTDGGTVVVAGSAADSVVPSGVGVPGVAPTGVTSAPARTSASAEANRSASASATPGATATPGAAATPSGTASPSTTAPPGATPAPGATPSGSASPSAAGPGALNVTVPANGYVALTPEAGRYLAVTQLPRDLRVGDALELRFTFTVQDGRTLTDTLRVPFGIPESPLPRSPIELPEEEEPGLGGGDGRGDGRTDGEAGDHE